MCIFFILSYSIKVFYGSGDCLVLNIPTSDSDDIPEIVRRLEEISIGCQVKQVSNRIFCRVNTVYVYMIKKCNLFWIVVFRGGRISNAVCREEWNTIKARKNDWRAGNSLIRHKSNFIEGNGSPLFLDEEYVIKWRVESLYITLPIKTSYPFTVCSRTVYAAPLRIFRALEIYAHVIDSCNIQLPESQAIFVFFTFRPKQWPCGGMAWVS